MLRLFVPAMLSIMAPAIPSSAQTLPCGARERLLGLVIDQQGQARLASGEAAQGATIELFADDSGDWTLLLTLPDGRSCLLANGRNLTATRGLQPARGNPA